MCEAGEVHEVKCVRCGATARCDGTGPEMNIGNYDVVCVGECLDEAARDMFDPQDLSEGAWERHGTLVAPTNGPLQGA